MAAEGGPAIDLRDEGTVRAAFFHMLVDWHGTDLKNVYEPLTDQFGYLYSAWLLIILFGIMFGLYKKWNRKRRETPLPYKVIKPPVNLTEGSTRKRVVAVIGATGFVGSYVVRHLVESGNYVVYMMGRRFTDSKINPGADAVFQVDMMNYEGLLNAFSGVDVVVHAAAAVPNVFLRDDDIWRINVVGSENVLSAAQKCGVKGLVFVTGLKCAGEVENKSARIFVNALTHVEQVITNADGVSGLHTCALQFGNIYGLSSFHQMILKGEVDRLPLLDNPVSWTPASFAANAVIKAVEKLTENDEAVVGKSLSIAGYPSTFKQFFSLKQWGVKIKNISPGMLRVLGKFNVMVAWVSGYAPFGVEMCPAVLSFFDFAEEEFDGDIARLVLGLDPIPTVEDGVADLRKEFEIKQASKTKKD